MVFRLMKPRCDVVASFYSSPSRSSVVVGPEKALKKAVAKAAADKSNMALAVLLDYDEFKAAVKRG